MSRPESRISGMTRWWWLRHAPVPDPEGRISGQLDLPCDTSDDDWFRALARRLPLNPVLVTSGLLRCQQTIGALEAAGMQLPPPVTEAELMEQHFGLWQGRSWGALSGTKDGAKDPAIADFWRDPAAARPPGGESFVDVVERVRPVIERLTAEYQGRDILAVAHAGTIRAALTIALEIRAEKAMAFAIEPLSITQLESFAEGGWRVAGVNTLPE